MQLNRVQEKFKDTILDHPKALENLPEDFAHVFEEGDIPLPVRLKIYRNNIVGSLTDLMLATFPLIEKLVGKEFLEGMVRSFVLKNPPDQGCLSTYGKGFELFIETFDPAKNLPYLSDIARLELAMNDAYYAPDDHPLTTEELALIAPEDLGDLKLRLRTSATLLRSQYPLTAIKEFAETNNSEDKLDISIGGGELLVYRPHLQSLIVTLAPDEFDMASRLKKGKSLEKAAEQTLSIHPDFDFGAFLSRHLELETFSSLSANTSDKEI